MSLIKNNSTISIILLALLVSIGGFFYYSLVLTPQLETLEALNADNEEKEQELQYLQQAFQSLGQRKLDLEDMNMQTKSLEDKIPTYEVAMIMMSEIIQYTDIYNFDNQSITLETALDTNQEEGKPYETLPITIEYTSTYEDSIKFLEMINRSDQMITIDQFVIDNQIQEADSEDLSFHISKDTVETELVLHMHCKLKGESEVYPNFIEYLGKEENIFERPKEFTIDELIEAHEGGTIFNIHLADILRSGDNYSFSGYSHNQDPVYVELTSLKDTKIVLTIREDSYTCLIEDIDGNQSEKTMDVHVVAPSVNITSQIQKVMEVMPTVSIYIRNYTPGVINVNMRGTSLETVRIYNENNELVAPGTQLGKIVVTR